MWKFISLFTKRDKMISYVTSEMDKIENDVDFIVSPCNTIPVILDEIRSHCSVPFLAIHEEVVKEVLDKKATKVGLLGTAMTIAGDFYQNELAKQGIAFQTLGDAHTTKLNELIFTKILPQKDYTLVREFLLNSIR